MKRIIVVMIIAAVVLSICACANSGEKVSAAGDPTAYFVRDNSWTMEEIVNEFGKFDGYEEKTYMFVDYLLYTRYLLPAFDRDWEFQLYSIPTEREEQITDAKFFFYKNEMSDKDFAKYSGKIVEYYTSAHGQPIEYNIDSNSPCWVWNCNELSIIFEDCREAGWMGIMVSKN